MSTISEEAVFLDDSLIMPKQFGIKENSKWHLLTVNRLEFFLVPFKDENDRRADIMDLNSFKDEYPAAQCLTTLIVHKHSHIQIPEPHLKSILGIIPLNYLWLRLFDSGYIRFYDCTEHTYHLALVHPVSPQLQ